MSQFYQLLAQIQADRGITDDEILPIRQYIEADGKLDLDDVKLLIELYCDADDRCPAFDELFFSTLERVFLADGQISPSEEFYLLKMLYSDREIREPERNFLRQLRKQLPKRSASFESLFDTAMLALPAGVILTTDADLNSRPSSTAQPSVLSPATAFPLEEPPRVGSDLAFLARTSSSCFQRHQERGTGGLQVADDVRTVKTAIQQY